jgi:hypothetical protein
MSDCGPCTVVLVAPTCFRSTNSDINCPPFPAASAFPASGLGYGCLSWKNRVPVGCVIMIKLLVPSF